MEQQSISLFTDHQIRTELTEEQEAATPSAATSLFAPRSGAKSGTNPFDMLDALAGKQAEIGKQMPFVAPHPSEQQQRRRIPVSHFHS